MVPLTFTVLAIIYGVINIFSSIIGMTQKKVGLLSGLLMFLGGISVTISVGNHFRYYGLFSLIIGLILIHISAISNAIKMYGKVNLKHHLIRFAFSLFIISLYFIKQN